MDLLTGATGFLGSTSRQEARSRTGGPAARARPIGTDLRRIPAEVSRSLGRPRRRECSSTRAATAGSTSSSTPPRAVSGAGTRAAFEAANARAHRSVCSTAAAREACAASSTSARPESTVPTPRASGDPEYDRGRLTDRAARRLRVVQGAKPTGVARVRPAERIDAVVTSALGSSTAVAAVLHRPPALPGSARRGRRLIVGSPSAPSPLTHVDQRAGDADRRSPPSAVAAREPRYNVIDGDDARSGEYLDLLAQERVVSSCADLRVPAATHRDAARAGAAKSRAALSAPLLCADAGSDPPRYRELHSACARDAGWCRASISDGGEQLRANGSDGPLISSAHRILRIPRMRRTTCRSTRAASRTSDPLATSSRTPGPTTERRT